MPPKPKLHKSKGKSGLPNAKAPKNEVNLSDNSSVPQSNNEDLQEQFELELCWCIQQLQRALNSGKLNQKQAQEQTKTLNTLMSNTTSFIKKRQIMRLTFGDYRAKMNEESKKSSRSVNMKISQTSPSQKSKFVKKSLCASGSDSSFKFNFVVDNTEDNLSSNMSKVEITDEGKSETLSESFRFVPSTNNFRFNFDVEDS